MKLFKIYALANELNLDRSNTGTITIPMGTWDYGEKKLEDGRTLYFKQTLDRDGAMAIVGQIEASIAKGEKGVPVYWGHPDVPELAHKYPDKRSKGWIKGASVNYPRNDVDHGNLVLTVEWLEENATEGFGWFSPYWTGPVTETGNGQAMMNVNALASVALVNMPNIQEFRLANELQDTKSEGRYHMNQKLIEELAAKRDGKLIAANEANYEESKHPRAEDGKWTSGGGAGGGSAKDWHGGATDTKGRPSRVSAAEAIRKHLTGTEKLSQFSPEFHKRFNQELGSWTKKHRPDIKDDIMKELAAKRK